MEEFVSLILDPIAEVFARFKLFFPNFLAMLVIIGLGFLLAWAVKAGLVKVLTAVKFDAWCDRAGFTNLMRKGDLWAKPSEVTGVVLYWFLVIIFIMVGLNALNIPVIDNLVSEFFLYLPRIFSALLILLVGYMVAGFFSRAVLIAAVNSGYPFAKVLAEAVRLLLIVLILAMALEQLNVAPSIVVAAFSIIFGGIVVALAISFGVGGIESAKRMIEKKDKEKERDIEHI
ncbi:MAG: hypothetical protein OEV28_12025 [Nitrospirota bacterium]|nr:hypothetical protein [Nitrospirota bacterium]